MATWDNFYIAANNAVRTGKHIGEVLGIDLLIKGLDVDIDKIHAIGHSLGGHLIGHFGRTIKKLGGNGPIHRITSLDPAKPWFDLTDDQSHKISKEDAKLVDVIHTNGGTLLTGALSLNEKLGDVDFYPNGGKHQPGCDEICPILIGCIHSNLWDLFFGSCSHHRSCDYYLESLHEYGQGRAIFVSKNCNNWSDFLANDCKEDTNDLQMGEGLQFVNQQLRSNYTFYLATNENPPFSKHDHQEDVLGYKKPLFGPDDAGGLCPNPSYLWNTQCCCGANCCWDECDLFYFSWWNYSLSTTDCLKGVPDSKWIFNSNLGYYQAFQFTTE